MIQDRESWSPKKCWPVKQRTQTKISFRDHETMSHSRQKKFGERKVGSETTIFDWHYE